VPSIVWSLNSFHLPHIFIEIGLINIFSLFVCFCSFAIKGLWLGFGIGSVSLVFGVWLQLLSAWPNNYVVSLYGNQSEMLYVSRSTATTTNAVTATISQWNRAEMRKKLWSIEDEESWCSVKNLSWNWKGVSEKQRVLRHIFSL